MKRSIMLSALVLSVAPVDSGTLVGMTLVTDKIVRGRLLQPFQPFLHDTLVFCSYPASPCASMSDPLVRAMPATQVAGLEVATGSRWLRGGVIGGAIGTLLVAGLISFGNGMCESTDCLVSGAWALTGTAVGFSIGALFGSTSIRWRPAR